MALSSALELPGSPVEQGSLETRTRYWSPAALLGVGVTISAPVCTVLAYDPANSATTTNVTSTVVAAGSPFLGSGAFAGMVGVTLHALTIGQEYRVTLSATCSDASVVEAYFRVRCLL